MSKAAVSTCFDTSSFADIRCSYTSVPPQLMAAICDHSACSFGFRNIASVTSWSREMRCTSTVDSGRKASLASGNMGTVRCPR
jgi:hypothetical protein